MIWYEEKIQNQVDHWKLVSDPNVSKIKSLDFFPFFLLIVFGHTSLLSICTGILGIFDILQFEISSLMN